MYRTLYSHLAKQGVVHFSPLKWPHSSLLTPCRARCGTFLTNETGLILLYSPFPLPELLNPNFFRSKNFNIFYDSGPEKFSERPRRAPNGPEKNFISEVIFFISEENFSISEVEMPDYEQNKRREPCVYGLSPLRYTNIQYFPPKSKSL